MRFRWDRHGKTGVVGCALVIASLSACSGKSDGNDDAGTGGVSASNGGTATGGRASMAGASGASTGGKSGAGAGGSPAGASGGPASGGAQSSGGEGGAPVNGGSSAQSGGNANGGSSTAGGASSDGGSSDAGAAAGESSSAGEGSGTGGSPGGPVWCPELEACRFGADQRLTPDEECPAGRECYEDVWCGKSIQCVEYVDDGSCTEKPACDPEQLSLMFCSGIGICETRSACGKSIMCETLPPAGAACQPGMQKDRAFAAPPGKCAGLSIECPEGSSRFVDEKCGCGCEQPEECPDSVNCQPTTSDPRSDLCDSEECPFTQRTH